MLEWIAENREWLFSGLGLAVLGAIWWLLRFGYARWKEKRITTSTSESSMGGQPVQYEKLRQKGFINRFPSFLMRVFWKPEDIASKIYIGLREETPIALSLNVEVPQIDLYFQITNLSHLDLVLDRMLIEAWFGQPTFTSAILRRYFIPAGEITKDIYFRYELNAAQQSQIENFVKSNQSRGSIHLYLKGYFESTVGRIEVKHSIERRNL